MARTSRAEEAILLASSDAAVADYLVKRGTEAKKQRWGEGISEETEAALLQRGNRLIDLRLAEYCLFSSTAQALFIRDPNDWALRSLLLSNQAMAEGHIMDRFPECLFEKEKGLLKYLSKISPDDASVLFKNPTLEDSFLENFLSLGSYWQAMPGNSRTIAVSTLAMNPKMQKEVEMRDHADGFGWHMAGKPFEHAWRLVINLDPTADNAMHLAHLYENLAKYCLKRDGILEALPKWKPQSDEELAKEAKDNERANTSDFQTIRRAAAAMLLTEYEVKQEALLASEDNAIRAGAYAAGKFAPAEMKAAVERDGWFAADSFLENPNCWRTAEHRDELLSGISGVDSDWIGWRYDRYANKYRNERPEWFADNEIETADEDRPLTESSIGELTRSVVTSSNFNALSGDLARLAGAQKLQFWLLLVVIGILVFRR
jgi:hypothetical protein